MNYTAANITTVLMFTMTLYVMVGRLRVRSDASWPLFYYLFLVLYHQAVPGKLEPWAVYSGVVCALFIRFEFLNKKLSKLIGGCELVILFYVAWRLIEIAGTLV
jgi:hypothetical protein